MNIFTKLTISIMLTGIVMSVFSQEMLYKAHQKVDAPFYDGNAVRNNFLKQQTANDTLWLPASVLFWHWDYFSAYGIYEYHENGLLKKLTWYDRFGDLASCYQYNNTYIDPLADVPDTLFWVGYEGVRPTYRYYYNNHQADSSYFEEYYQEWDGEKWNTEEKTYVHLLDTLSVSEFQDHVEVFDRYGNITKGRKTFLTFDEQGNVIEAIAERYDVATKQYKSSYKYVYLYDSDGNCYNRNAYLYSSSGTWKISTKLTNIKWFEFHGFDNGDLLFFGYPLGLYYQYSPKNKNKMSSLKFWISNGLHLNNIDTIKWNLEPFSCHHFYYDENICLWSHDYYEYNEHYHLISDGSLLHESWNCDTVVFDYLKNEYVNKYDDRGRRYEYIDYQEALSELSDTLFHSIITYAVDSFTYVIRPPVGMDELPLAQRELQIVPNPSNDTVRIVATDDIATITLYAADGRLAHSQAGSGREAMVNLQGVAKGVYVVQVRLKNGGVQTGKVIKN